MQNVLAVTRTVMREVMTRAVLISWAITSVVVAVSGPFGTFGTRTLAWRLGYWSLLIAAALILAVAIRIAARTLMADRPAWMEDGVVIGALSITFGPFVVWFNTWFIGPGDENISVPVASGVVAAVSVAIIYVRRAVSGPPKMPPPMRRDRLLDRLGARDGARLVKVSSDNHHIKVVTSDGEEYRILMRLRDAVAEIDVEPGICVHRSHWIALDHIEDVQMVDGREVVRMPCGLTVPVGPKYRRNLVEIGQISV